MDTFNAQRICFDFSRSNDTPLRVKRAIEKVLGDLGKLQRHCWKQRPVIIDGKDCCPECNEILDTVAKRRVCPNCGKGIEWSDIDWGDMDWISAERYNS